MLRLENLLLTPAVLPRSDDHPQPVANAGVTGRYETISRAEPAHAVTRDYAEREKGKPTVLDYLRYAQRKSGRRPMDLAWEFRRLTWGRGKLTLPEYVQYGVYDTTRYSMEDQARFITIDLSWPIARVCNDKAWEATIEDKWLCAHILDRSAIAVPETLAVIDKTGRSYPGARNISTAAQLRDFVTSQGALPLFCKENSGVCSFGAFVIVDADAEAMVLKEQGRLGYDACMDQFVGATPYLLQRLLRNHSFFDRYTESLATVRVCTLVTEKEVKIPFTILKLPSRRSIADNFWRPGNLACNVDVASGRILTARSKDKLGTTDHMSHPETGALLIGETMPMWDRVLDLARRSAPILWPLRYQSMDIAITPDGPVLVEINFAGGFDLPQLASGQGFLTDEVRGFFRACGYKKL